ncbi:Glutathione S-transferase, N-terminal [Dillenia turbinata]|uniref:glutathione transferase n=1 Tax=Dillenia turbinata TaxID=194707 RepID=A0AAN8ZKI5_9MAGN
MGLKVYGVPMSACTARVLACLHEKGLEFEFVPVNFFGGEHKQPPFLEKNPFGQIPVLEDGDLTLFESRAITGYIADKFKDTGCDLIRHGDCNKAAVVRVWVEVEAQQYNPAIRPILYQCFVVPLIGKTSDQKIIDESLEKLGNVLDVYEARLSKTKYLAGDHFTLADLNHLSYTFYFMKTPYASLIESRPHVKAWWEDISSRPAFVKVSVNMKFEAN